MHSFCFVADDCEEFLFLVFTVVDDGVAFLYFIYHMVPLLLQFIFQKGDLLFKLIYDFVQILNFAFGWGVLPSADLFKFLYYLVFANHLISELVDLTGMLFLKKGNVLIKFIDVQLRGLYLLFDECVLCIELLIFCLQLMFYSVQSLYMGLQLMNFGYLSLSFHFSRCLIVTSGNSYF